MSIPVQLQMDVAAYLEAHAEFQYVPVIREWADVNAGDALLDDYVNNHLIGDLPKNGKFGLACIVSSPIAKITAENSPGPVENYEFVIQCLENTAVNKDPANGTLIRADELAETVKRLLHLWSHDGGHDIGVISSEMDRDPELPAHIRGWLVSLRSMAHALTPYPFVSAPRISFSGQSMTLASFTSGADIWWTHDGSFPSPANAAAALYSGAVDVSALPSGTLIRAVAFKTALRASDCSAKFIP